MASMTSSGTIECDATNQTSSPADATSAARFIQCRAGSISGLLEMRAESLRKATIEPVNVTAPMKTPRKISTRCTASPPPTSARYVLTPTSTAAAPTKECSIAMSSGMPVISTRRARQMPMLAPIVMATTIATQLNRAASRRASHSVATSAIAMPIMPRTLPSRAVSCFDRPASERMKSRAATM